MTTTRKKAAAVAADHKKDELVEAAEHAGVKSTGTKQEIATELVKADVDVDAVSNVVDDGVHDIDLPAPQVGQWVDVVDGEYAGKHANYLQDSTTKKDGSPDVILVRLRDASNEVVEVPYSSVRGTSYLGGR